MQISAGLRATKARAAAVAGCFIFLSCMGHATGFVAPALISCPPHMSPPHGAALASGLRLRGLQRPQPQCTRELSDGPQRHSLTSVQAQSAPQTELVSEVMKQTVLVEASVERCFGVASDLDGYRVWCGKGGMKKVEVLVRNENNLATQVKVITF